MPNQLITNLVFQGGSVKGIAYVGAMDRLDMSKIKRVAGTSAGSITAGLLAVGCTPKDVKDLLDEFDFEAILDDGVGATYTRGKVLKTVDKVSNGKSPVLAVKPLKVPNPVVVKPTSSDDTKTSKLVKPTEPVKMFKPVKKVVAHRLYQQGGLYEGEYLRLWLEGKIQEQVKKLTNGAHTGENLTFAELHQLTLDYPNVGFRDLKVVASNFTRGEKKVFSCDNPEYKDVIISDAIRMSMSIPGLFKPYQVYAKIDGVRCVLNAEMWEDGGVYDNYPIDCFDEERYMDEDEEMFEAEDGRRYNQQTLGFRLVSAEHKKYCEDLRDNGEGEKPRENKDGFIGVASGLLSARTPLQEERYNRKENLERTVYIDHLNVSMFSFNLSDERKAALVQSGEEAVDAYLERQAPVAIPVF
ncbi:patatin-like phospholipase family protein [Legionella saoudiensis]|uniref:patatin-like phospholipase family protein n=1 Tax=Legionella saoudiensis TaxID=1750561 RepID=UPI0007313315|nr:patatin-like phospholipase family protein [Legionella saoudiensis]